MELILQRKGGREIEDIKIRSSYVLSLLMCLPISQFRVNSASSGQELL